MEETQPLPAHLKQLDCLDGFWTSRTITGYSSPPLSPQQRYSLPGHRSIGRFHYQRTEIEAVDFAAHHVFASPRVVRAVHDLKVEERVESVRERKTSARDSVMWRNRREVARNLFLDRV